MKKVISLFFVLVMCLSLCACGKSEAVKNVEAMIDALGEITLESIDAICSAEDAYFALTEDEQKKVDNYEILAEARDAYYELALVGNWYSSEISLDVESNYEKLGFVLNSDLSCTNYEYGSTSSGVWSVTDGILRTNFEEGWENSYIIKDVDGIISLQLEYSESGRTMMKEEDYFAYLNEIFLIVELSAENVADYCRLDLYTPHYYTNEWGETVELTTTGTTLLARNNVYEDGWLYLCSSSDLTIEVLYPEYTLTYTYTDSTSTETYPAGATTSTESNPYVCYFPMELDRYFENYTITTDLSLEELSFGRAKGQIIFINSKFVEEVVCDKYEYRRSLKTVFSEGLYNTGFWNESMGDY